MCFRVDQPSSKMWPVNRRLMSQQRVVFSPEQRASQAASRAERRKRRDERRKGEAGRGGGAPSRQPPVVGHTPAADFADAQRIALARGAPPRQPPVVGHTPAADFANAQRIARAEEPEPGDDLSDPDWLCETKTQKRKRKTRIERPGRGCSRSSGGSSRSWSERPRRGGGRRGRG